MGEEPTKPKPSPHPTPRNGVLFFKNRFPKTVYIGLLELLIATGQGADAHRPPPYAVLSLEALITSELASSSPNIHFELSGEGFSIPIQAFRRAGLPTLLAGDIALQRFTQNTKEQTNPQGSAPPLSLVSSQKAPLLEDSQRPALAFCSQQGLSPCKGALCSVLGWPPASASGGGSQGWMEGGERGRRERGGALAPRLALGRTWQELSQPHIWQPFEARLQEREPQRGKPIPAARTQPGSRAASGRQGVE